MGHKFKSSAWFLPGFKNLGSILEFLAPPDFPNYPGFYPGFKISVDDSKCTTYPSARNVLTKQSIELVYRGV